MITTNLPRRPTRIQINGRTGQVIKKDEVKPTNHKPKPRKSLNETELGQTMGKYIENQEKAGTKEERFNGIDEALNKAIERAAISAIEKNPELIQDAVADLIAKKIKDKLSNL
jgi:hypothetical protein